MSKGLPIVLSAPSGGGKSTIAEELLKRLPNAVRSISCTTRAPRDKEKNGQDYFFLSKQEFEQRIEAGDFLEWANVHEHMYGTPMAAFQSKIKEGKDVLLVIDPQGAVSVKKKYPEGIFIFIVPPTWDILIQRLKERGTDDPKTIDVRLTNARKELEYLSSYDYLIINEDLMAAVQDVQAVLKAERHRINRIDRSEVPILN